MTEKQKGGCSPLFYFCADSGADFAQLQSRTTVSNGDQPIDVGVLAWVADRICGVLSIDLHALSCSGLIDFAMFVSQCGVNTGDKAIF